MDCQAIIPAAQLDWIPKSYKQWLINTKVPQ